MWFALLPSRRHTSTDDAASWNQAYIPPIPLPAVEDSEDVDPSDTSPPAVAGEAVALLHGNTTHSTNFNDNSSVGDNINKTVVGHVYQHHLQLSPSTPLLTATPTPPPALPLPVMKTSTPLMSPLQGPLHVRLSTLWQCCRQGRVDPGILTDKVYLPVKGLVLLFLRDVQAFLSPSCTRRDRPSYASAVMY